MWTINWITNQANNGFNMLTAVARDMAGNATTSGAIGLTVNNDKTSPTISITSPTSNQTVVGTVLVTATASDDVGVASVRFMVDGANLGSPVTSAPFQVSWDTSQVIKPSNHTLTATVADMTGNVTLSSAVTVLVSNDITPPNVSITAPTANQTVSGTFNVTATASDNVAVASVQFKLDGNNLGSPVTSAPYQTTWNTTTATNTSHSLTAVASDAAGNPGTSSPIQVTVSNLDTTPPTVFITSPSASQTVSGTITVMATASDNVGVKAVQFQLDGNNLGSPVTSAPYQTTWNTTTATNTSHSLTAVATDTSNNTGTSTAVTVTVNNDTTPPAVSITAPTANQTVSGTSNVTATASDNVAVAGRCSSSWTGTTWDRR